MTTTQAPSSDFVGQVPPQDLDAERSVLGAVLLSADALMAVSDSLTPGELYLPTHQAIYAAALELFRRGDPVDAITMSAELERRGELVRIGGAPYLHTLIETTPTAVNVGYYVTIVAEKAVLRRLVAAGMQITQLGYGRVEGADVAVVVDRAQAAIHEATTSTTRVSDVVTGGTASAAVLASLSDDTPRDLVLTGLPDLDHVIGGLEPGELTVVCGRPGHGKTLLGMQVAQHAALKQNKAAFVFSLEMSRDLLMQRMLAATSGVKLARVSKREPLEDADWQRLVVADAEIAAAPLFISDSTYQATATIRSTLRRHSQLHGTPAVVVIDYLGLLTPIGRADTRAQEIATQTRELKILAGELGVPIVLLQQLNRQAAGRASKRPVLTDLRESGAIEQDAYAVIGVHTPCVDDPDDASGEAELCVIKNRQGAPGVVSVAWQAHLGRFASLHRS